ncbi:hypothetical protein [Candidatus Reidiella endopervernicosa]|uniref:Uncharacterized protein n=1 Tax=Candidatus Reidiella endopervernicosa TaxID=2738883 RepID=A0A6N0HX67_9GAMM|nr:hypothetical protein [Candidatus Reidiella endopervernicosa]QKQ26973.1 hypothetical protein HUE57_12310 [Candidatus Reidiella endopervernicosa]
MVDAFMEIADDFYAISQEYADSEEDVMAKVRTDPMHQANLVKPHYIKPTDAAGRRVLYDNLVLIQVEPFPSTCGIRIMINRTISYLFAMLGIYCT